MGRFKQPRRVGWFSEPADLQGGPHIFSNAEKQENKREQGTSTLAGGPGPRGPPLTLRGWIQQSSILE